MRGLCGEQCRLLGGAEAAREDADKRSGMVSIFSFVSREKENELQIHFSSDGFPLSRLPFHNL